MNIYFPFKIHVIFNTNRKSRVEQLTVSGNFSIAEKKSSTSKNLLFTEKKRIKKSRVKGQTFPTKQNIFM